MYFMNLYVHSFSYTYISNINILNLYTNIYFVHMSNNIDKIDYLFK